MQSLLNGLVVDSSSGQERQWMELRHAVLTVTIRFTGHETREFAQEVGSSRTHTVYVQHSAFNNLDKAGVEVKTYRLATQNKQDTD